MGFILTLTLSGRLFRLSPDGPIRNSPCRKNVKEREKKERNGKGKSEKIRKKEEERRGRRKEEEEETAGICNMVTAWTHRYPWLYVFVLASKRPLVIAY